MKTTQISDTGLPRVRIHLNLHNPERAESTLQMQKPNGKWVVVGYAEELVMDDVRPIMKRSAQEKIAAGGDKTVCCFLEGDMRWWKGRLREQAMQEVPELATQLAQWQTDSLQPERDAEYMGKPCLQQTGLEIGFNPRKYKPFYAKPATRGEEPQQALAHAGRLVGMGWRYFAYEPQLRPMQEQEYIAQPTQDAGTTVSSIAEGMRATQARLQVDAKCSAH